LKTISKKPAPHFQKWRHFTICSLDGVLGKTPKSSEKVSTTTHQHKLKKEKRKSWCPRNTQKSPFPTIQKHAKTSTDGA